MAQTPVDLALAAAESEEPGEGLRTVAALRTRLDGLEALQVEKAVRAGWSWRQVAEVLGVTKQAVHKKHARRVAARLAEDPGEGGGDRKRLVVTGHARQSVQFAREEAAALGASSVGPEHLLLGLLRDDRGPAIQALRAVGVSFDSARREIERLRPTTLGTPARARSAQRGDPLPVSPEARAVMEQSLREAVRRRDGHLGVEHLLLALLRDADSPPVRAMSAVGTDPAAVERAIDVALGRAA